MVEAVSEHWLPSDQRDPSRWKALLHRLVSLLRFGLFLAALALLGWGAATEARTSYLQSRLLSRWVGSMNFVVRPGPSDTIRFPKWGPYDERLGYAKLPSFIESLSARHFAVAHQAQWSRSLDDCAENGGYAIYGEKSRTGFELFDRDRNPLYRVSYPQRTYDSFQSIPPLVVDTLLFVEDQASSTPGIDDAIRQSTGDVLCLPQRGGSPGSWTAASRKAAQAHSPPRSRSFAIRRVAARPASRKSFVR